MAELSKTAIFPNPRCKQMLLTASAKALRICMFYPDPELSFSHIHEKSASVSHREIIFCTTLWPNLKLKWNAILGQNFSFKAVLLNSPNSDFPDFIKKL